jgi:dGTPase
MISPSPQLAEKKTVLEQFLFDNVYRHPGVLAKRLPSQQSLREMFNLLITNAVPLPGKFQRIAESEGLPRAVADYLAGMTDRFAFEEHRRLKESTR